MAICDDPQDMEIDEDTGGAVPLTSNVDTPLEVRGDPASIPGCIVLNNVGSLLTRTRARCDASHNQKHFLEHLVATTAGKSVPLVYPEGMLFPSIFWKTDNQDTGI